MKTIKEMFPSYPRKAQVKLEELRSLIHNIAEKTEGVGRVEESFKWGELSFSTPETKSGSTIRIDWKEKKLDSYSLYFNCRTQLISIYKELFPHDFSYEGNRCINLKLNEKLPKRKVSKCIEIALTYNSKNYKNFMK